MRRAESYERDRQKNEDCEGGKTRRAESHLRGGKRKTG